MTSTSCRVRQIGCDEAGPRPGRLLAEHLLLAPGWAPAANFATELFRSNQRSHLHASWQIRDLFQGIHLREQIPVNPFPGRWPSAGCGDQVRVALPRARMSARPDTASTLASGSAAPGRGSISLNAADPTRSVTVGRCPHHRHPPHMRGGHRSGRRTGRTARVTVAAACRYRTAPVAVSGTEDSY